jgi:hypothetical protein
MDPKDEKELESTYRELLSNLIEVSGLLSKINSLLPERERLGESDTGTKLQEIVDKARTGIVKAVLEPQRTENVGIDTKRICAELDKKAAGFFDVNTTKAAFGTIYWDAKETLIALMFNEADRLLPWRLDSPDTLVKGKSLLLRHPVTECRYGGSPEGGWLFEDAVSSLEKLIRIDIQSADPRTVSGELLRGVYHANRQNPWGKLQLHDPVFVSTKMYKNGKLELELASGEMVRNVAAFLFKLHTAKKAGMEWS